MSSKYLSRNGIESDRAIKEAIERHEAGTAHFYSKDEFLAHLDEAIKESARYAQA